MIRTAEDVRRIIDGTDTRPQGGNSRQRKNYQRRDAHDGNGHSQRRMSPVHDYHDYQERGRIATHVTSVPPSAPKNDLRDPIIRRGRTLGLSSKPVPRPEGTSSQPSGLGDIDGKDIDVLYRVSNPAKKNQAWKDDGFICVNSTTSTVSLKNSRKVTVAGCPLTQFDVNKFNAGDEMHMDKYDYMKNS